MFLTDPSFAFSSLSYFIYFHLQGIYLQAVSDFFYIPGVDIFINDDLSSFRISKPWH